MGEPSRRSVERDVLDHFDRTSSEPVTAVEVAEETGYSVRTVTTTLTELADRGRLQTKTVAERHRVWWSSRRDHAGTERADSHRSLDDASERRGAAGADHRLLEQHRQLARLATRINVTDDLDAILRLITEEARELVGAISPSRVAPSIRTGRKLSTRSPCRTSTPTTGSTTPRPTGAGSIRWCVRRTNRCE